MGKYLYAFAAKDIQNYILRGDKLKEMVGGSELINSLCQDYFQQCLDKLQIDKNKYKIITQAAGWAKVLFDDKNAAELFYKYWPLLADRFAPGLHIVQTIEEITWSFADTATKCEIGLISERNVVQPSLPEIGPLIDRNPRTGFAATDLIIHRNDGQVLKELEDSQSNRKAAMSEKSKNLIEKMAGKGYAEKWPNKMDEISGDGKKYIAIIHADGNSLGKILIKLQDHLKKKSVDEAASIYTGLSKAIEEATEKSVHEAYQKVLLPDYEAQKVGKKIMAARPIVIGGDDLSIIIRADIAFNFTKIFLETFEKVSLTSIEKNLGKFNIKDLPEKLTSCAGIAFVKDGYPFSRAYELAESLCRHTKDIAKTTTKGFVPSGFTFYKVSTSIAGDYDTIKEKELMTKEDISLCFGPYGVGDPASKLPPFNNLNELSQTLNEDGMPAGSIRKLITTLYSSSVNAKADFERILQVLKGKGKEKIADDLKNQLIKLTDNKDEPLWSINKRSPILDAHRLCELSFKAGGAI